jgi:hypothetical protein
LTGHLKPVSDNERPFFRRDLTLQFMVVKIPPKHAPRDARILANC